MNKKYINIIANVIICSTIFACNTNPKTSSNTTIIKINPNEATEFVNLSEIVESVEYIPLKTPEDNPMGQVMLTIVKEKYIYAFSLDPNAVFVFDKKGEFIAKLNKSGRGPGEYTFITGVFVDDNEKFIEIMSDDGSIKKYNNITFDFISETDIPYVATNNSAKSGDKYYFSPQQMENIINDKPTNTSLVIMQNGQIIKTAFDKKIKTTQGNHSNFWSPNYESFCVNDKGELFISTMYDNSFYQLEDTIARAILTVDFGNKGINNEQLTSKPTYEQYDYLESMNGLASFPVLNVYSDELIAFSYNFKDGVDDNIYTNMTSPFLGNIYQYIKLNDKVYHTKRIKNDITDFPNYVDFVSYQHVLHQPQYKDYLIDVIQPYKYIPEDASQIQTKALGAITIEDNPIVVLMKLKK